MRICFFHAEPAWSGRTRAFADAAAALAATGHEVTFVCARGDGASLHLEPGAYDVIAIRTDDGWARVAWRLRAVLRRSSPDVVFVHSEREQFVAAVASRMADRCAVLRRVPPFGQLTLGRAARVARTIAPAGLLFSLDHDARAAQPQGGEPEPAVAPPGVAMATPVAEGGHEHDIRTLAVVHDGRHRAQLSTALGAVALLAERHGDLRATVLGPADVNDALRLHAAALHIGDIVEIVETAGDRVAEQGSIAHAELGLVLAQEDDAAFAVLDCWAAGVPVIAERSALLEALVTDGETGVLPARLEATGLAAVIAGLLADLPRREALTRASRAAAARWPLSAMCEGFERAARLAHDRSSGRV